MLTAKFIRENKDEVIRRLKIKNFHDIDLINSIIQIDDDRKLTKKELDSNLQQQKSYSKIFEKTIQKNNFKQNTLELKNQEKYLLGQLQTIERNLNRLLYQIPNLPSEEVPVGNSPIDNVCVKESGELPILHKNSKPHWELIKEYDIINFELGNKLTGAGFPVYRGKGAKLQRALISFFLDEAINAGYEEIQPPILVNENSCFSTGQLPEKEKQMYECEVDKLYLIPTAEVPITNIYRDVLIQNSDFSIKHCGYTPCFRREAGSYGSDVRGLNRLHQFDKVELVRIEHPNNSYNALNEMLVHVEQLLIKLNLPYRILKLCGGDMSFTSALTYDFEVYSATQKKWLEVSSVSNFENFQSNRLNLKFKDAVSKSNVTAHTLNGSALALPRIVAALLENNQTENGILIPSELIKYTGFEIIN